jgi:hypothetical protein
MPVELKEPALRLMTWVENNRDQALAVRFIEDLCRKPLAEIADSPYVSEPLGPILEQHTTQHRARARRPAWSRGGHHRLLDEKVGRLNKFIVYYLHPEARYSVTAAWRRASKMKISVGSNPGARPAHPQHRRHLRALRRRRPPGGGRHLAAAADRRARARSPQRSSRPAELTWKARERARLRRAELSRGRGPLRSHRSPGRTRLRARSSSRGRGTLTVRRSFRSSDARALARAAPVAQAWRPGVSHGAGLRPRRPAALVGSRKAPGA